MEKGGLLKKTFSLFPVPINSSPDPAPADVRFDLYPPALTSPSSLGLRHVRGEKIWMTGEGETTQNDVQPGPGHPASVRSSTGGCSHAQHPQAGLVSQAINWGLHAE